MSIKSIQPSFYITDEAIEKLRGGGAWTIREVPLKIASEIRSHFGIDSSFCVFASGNSPPPTNLSPNEPIAGIDWIRIEDNPKPNETTLNVYHFMVTQKTNAGYPVFYMGQKDSIAPHWSELEDLSVYFKIMAAQLKH